MGDVVSLFIEPMCITIKSYFLKSIKELELQYYFSAKHAKPFNKFIVKRTSEPLPTYSDEVPLYTDDKYYTKDVQIVNTLQIYSFVKSYLDKIKAGTSNSYED